MQRVETRRTGEADSSAILVVDDDPGVCHTIRWALEDEGFPVTTAENGQVALEYAGRQRPALVVLDMAMPVLNGYGFAAGFERLYGRDVPILVLTADGRAEQKAKHIGAFDFIHKPFEVDDLIEKVRKGLHS